MFTKVFSEYDDRNVEVYVRRLEGLKIAKRIEKAMFDCAGKNFWHLKHERADKLILMLIASLVDNDLTVHYYLFDEENYLQIKDCIGDIFHGSSNYHDMDWHSVNEFSFEEEVRNVTWDAVTHYLENETVENLWGLNYLAECLENYKLADSFGRDVVVDEYCGHMCWEEFYPLDYLYPSYFDEPTVEEMWFWMRYTDFNPCSDFAKVFVWDDKYNIVLADYIERY